MTTEARCERCKLARVSVDADDAEVFGLPRLACKCDVIVCLSVWKSEGLAWVSTLELELLNKAKVRTSVRPVDFVVRHKSQGGSHIRFERLAPLWAVAILRDLAMPGAMKVALLRKPIDAPELMPVVMSLARLHGDEAVIAFLLNGLRPREDEGDVSSGG